MLTLIISVGVVLVVSAMCSLAEAAIYAVRRPYIRQLTESGSAAGRILERFKQNMEQPITAILIVNTAANTAGASVAGAQARQELGEASLIWFSAAFTIAVLFISEIIPKIAGVAYSRQIAPLASIPLNAVVHALYPVVWLTQHLSRFLQRGKTAVLATEEELHHMAALSAEEGGIMSSEADLIQNALLLDQVKAERIMTPRNVVTVARDGMTVKEFCDREAEKLFSRIPIYAADDPENWVGVVRSQDILAEMAKDRFDTTLESLAKPIAFVPEATPGHKLLNEFLKRQAHLLGVVDEYGSVVGIVTLEDILESLIGSEIVDETDTIPDLQREARARGSQRLRQSQRGSDGDD